jgi:hypothetical protein
LPNPSPCASHYGSDPRQLIRRSAFIRWHNSVSISRR